MSVTVFLAVLFAAALHAVWNALVKGASDKTLNMTLVILGQSFAGGVVLFFVPPVAPETWPWIAVAIFLHGGYQIFLLFAYRIGDFSQVYPLARGSAPLMVTAVSVLVLGVELSFWELLAIGLIACGILSLTLVRRSDGQRAPRAAAYALVTGCFIAGYTLIDGLGAQVSGSPVAMFSWIALGNFVTFGAFMLWKHPGDLAGLPRNFNILAFIGGIASYVAFAIVMWAFTHAPIPLVAALRETSIAFAVLIGVLIFRERLDLIKLAATMLTISGAALLRLARA